jgi:nucleotide-binding universal stress UspA family protein
MARIVVEVRDMMLQKILVTLDGSALARAALPKAVKLASGDSTAVVLVEVIEPLDVLHREAEEQFELTDGSAAKIEELAQQMHFNKRHRALDDLARAEAELHAAGVRAVQTIVAEGLAGNEIVGAAEREHCDAIVMSTRGHGGLGREVIGSVAEYVLRHAGDAAVVLVGPRASA